jgi:Ni/Co efflux regulator RcnB
MPAAPGASAAPGQRLPQERLPGRLQAVEERDHLGYYTRYVEVDYRDHHLKPPPRGYHYVRDDKGDIILPAVATGLIASIIAGSN